MVVGSSPTIRSNTKKTMNIDAFYTHSEKNDRKYPLGKAVSLAEANLRARGHTAGICTDAMRGRSQAELVTLKEVNDVAEQIYWDSRSYN